MIGLFRRGTIAMVPWCELFRVLELLRAVMAHPARNFAEGKRAHTPHPAKTHNREDKANRALSLGPRGFIINNITIIIIAITIITIITINPSIDLLVLAQRVYPTIRLGQRGLA